MRVENIAAFPKYGEHPESVNKFLAEMNAERWRLVGAVKYGLDTFYLFERPLEDELRK
jgi:hypothetical protein